MITSVNNEAVKRLVALGTSAKERKKSGLFVAEGVKMFMEAPKDWIDAVYVCEGFLESDRATEEVKEKIDNTRHEILAKHVFDKASDTVTPQGLITVLKQPMHKASDIIAQDNPLILVLENLQDPGNLGTILRTSEAAGVTGVILNNEAVSVFNPKTVRATMGSIYRVKYAYVDDLVPVMEEMKRAGIETYAAHLKGDTYYEAFDFKKPTAFLIGNEGNGLSDKLSSMASKLMKIPMEGSVESLNAGVAAAVLMYESHRQRHKK